MIELMVSLTISLLISAAAIGVFISGRQAARYSDALARYQESLRFAQAAMTEDIRMAGNLGCRHDSKLATGAAAITPTPGSFLTFGSAMSGVNSWNTDSSALGSVGSAKAAASTDAIRLEFASREGNMLNVDMATIADDISVADGITYAENEPLIIADCTSAGLFKAKAGTTSTTIKQDALTQTYKAYISSVYRFIDRTYYVNSSAQLIQNTGGTEQVISEGIEDLQISYGVDAKTPTDGVANQYLDSLPDTATWGKVTAVRVCMLVVSHDAGLTTQSKYTNCAGNSTDIPDTKLRFPVTFTVQLRNRS